MDKKFDISNAVSYGWEQFKENIGFYIVAVLIMMVVAAIPNGLSQIGYYSSNTAVVVIFGVLFGLLGIVVGIFVNLAQIRIGLTACDQQPVNFEDLYSEYPKFLNFLGGSILYMLMVIGGLILLIIPGIYLAVKYWFFAYLIVDQDMGPIDALKKSGQMTKGSWWHLFLFFLAMFGIMLLGWIACCVGIFVAIPIMLVASAYVYRSLLASTGTTAVVPPQDFAAPPPEVPPAAPQA